MRNAVWCGLTALGGAWFFAGSARFPVALDDSILQGRTAIVDARTKRPIAGAEVLSVQTLREFASTTIMDADGKARMAIPVRGFGKRPVPEGVSITVYKKGRRLLPGPMRPLWWLEQVARAQRDPLAPFTPGSYERRTDDGPPGVPSTIELTPDP